MNKRHRKNPAFLIAVATMSLIMLHVSCKDKNETDEASSTSLNEFIMSLKDPIQIGSTNGEETIGDVLAEVDEETHTYCECTKHKMSSEFSEVMLMDPTSNVIYPGSIIDGNSVIDGSYRQIVLDRAPLTISTDFKGTSTSPFRTIENPTLSQVRQAEKEMLYEGEISGATAAAMSFEVKEIKSEEELKLAVGASVSYKKLKLDEKFDFSKTSKTSKFMLKFQQVYYTIDVDAPSTPAGFFSKNVTADDLRNAIGGKNTVPVYVSSVKYGRVAYVCVESNMKSDSVANMLNASFKFGGDSVVIKTSVEHKKKMEECKISGSVIGGAADSAVTAIRGYEGILSFITSGGNFSKNSPGKPVAFTLTRLSDNSVFNVVNGTEYVSRKCWSTNASIVPLDMYGIKGNDSICGTITLTVYKGNTYVSSPFYLFNRAICKESALFIEQGKAKPIEPSNDTQTFEIGKDEDATLLVQAKLIRWQTPCGCGNRHEYDEFDTYTKAIPLSEVIENNGIVTLDEIKLTRDFTEGHDTYKALGIVGKTRTKHDPHYTATDSRVRFRFQVKFNQE